MLNAICNTDNDNHELNEGVGESSEEVCIIGSVGDLGVINFSTLSDESLSKYGFLNQSLAYEFYKAFATVHGFSIRKNKVDKNKDGVVCRIAFVCSGEEQRKEKYLQNSNRKREPKTVTRFGCKAELRVVLKKKTGLWRVKFFNNDHSHGLLGDNFGVFHRSQRGMTNFDVIELMGLKVVGISTPHAYELCAQLSGGYDKVGYRKRDMYNKIHILRKCKDGNTSNAITYLTGMQKMDPCFFWRHTVNEDGRIDKLFWCDGCSRYDYQLFGDVLAFDATYGKNKYNCPIVVFSGVNHHNMTIVFATAVVSDEVQSTYEWVLETFVEAMCGKASKCVITNGALSMKNAIALVFPEAHHRLCAWHLIRNASVRVGNTHFTHLFRKCMLSDYEIGTFEQKWKMYVKQCSVEDHPWVSNIIKTKEMWAAAYMRGKFFAGFRTTSRCEALHAQLGKFICHRNDLAELLHHFQRAINSMRNSEMDADFNSLKGLPVMQTHLVSLELHAAKVFTREIFHMFQKFVIDAMYLRVIGFKETPSYRIYEVVRYEREDTPWRVCYSEGESSFKCSCMRMESFGIPCAHIVAVLFMLNITELPDSLLLDRWKKTAKLNFDMSCQTVPWGEEALKYCRYGGLMDWCRRLCSVACGNLEDYTEQRNILAANVISLESKNDMNAEGIPPTDDDEHDYSGVRDPAIIKSKSCATTGSGNTGKRKRVIKCGICRIVGHTRKACPIASQVERLKEQHDKCTQSSRESMSEEFEIGD